MSQEGKADSLPFDEVIFVGIRGHFFFRTAIDHRDLVGAEAFGDGGAINRGITRANHDNIASDDKFVHVQFALLDVFQPIQNVFLAGNARE